MKKTIFILLFFLSVNLHADINWYGANNQAGQEWLNIHSSSTIPLNDLCYYTVSETVNSSFVGVHNKDMWEFRTGIGSMENKIVKRGKKFVFGPDFDGSSTSMIRIFCPSVASSTSYIDLKYGEAGACRKKHFAYKLIGSSTLFMLKSNRPAIKEIK